MGRTGKLPVCHNLTNVPDAAIDAPTYLIEQLPRERIEELREISGEWLRFCEFKGLMFKAGEASVDAWLKMLWMSGTDLVFVARDAGRIVGATFWTFLPLPFDPHVVSGTGTYVMSGYRQQGVATALRERATAKAKQMGATRIVGQTQKGDDAAAQSARRAGFYPFATAVEACL